MKIHLVTYATPRFRHRQWILGWSAKANRVADTVTHWTPQKLLAAGFEEHCKDIKLSERGSGFWAWKPFIIAAKLREVPAGDLVFYCDVGRLYPFKLLDQPVTQLVRWMVDQGQDILPGVEIPWDGPTSVWTKREALVRTKMDFPEVHSAIPVQASFSLWRAGSASQEFVNYWLDLCSQRPLVSDDPSQCDLPELVEFRGHRHDQALLTLCCIARQIRGLCIGPERPAVDTRNPSQVSGILFGRVSGFRTITGTILRAAIWPVEQIELTIRQKVRIGKTINE